MSVSSNLLCSFELLKPLDSNALKSHIKKGRNARQNMLNSPVSHISSSFINGRSLILIHSRPRPLPRASRSSTGWILMFLAESCCNNNDDSFLGGQDMSESGLKEDQILKELNRSDAIDFAGVWSTGGIHCLS